MRSAGRRDVRYQVNVPLNDAHWHLVLMQLALRDDTSVPELLRPVIIDFLRLRLEEDSDLAAAVQSLEQSKARAHKQA